MIILLGAEKVFDKAVKHHCNISHRGHKIERSCPRLLGALVHITVHRMCVFSSLWLLHTLHNLQNILTRIFTQGEEITQSSDPLGVKF